MKKSILILLFIVLICAIALVVWYFYSLGAQKWCCQDDLRVYNNIEYGFRITLPDSWKNYTVEKKMWQGQGIEINNQDVKYSGPMVVIKNPKTTSQVKYQDIPIMVISPDVWQGVIQERIAVSAAPIGPAKIGENSKYVFATPPRWYGFTDAQGWQEAVDAVKTFKAF